MRNSSYKINRLIEAMDRSEKRYFKLFVSKYEGGDNYLKLFDLTDAFLKKAKGENFQEGVLRQEFGKSTGNTRYAETKYYLYSLILKSQQSYHSCSSVDAEISEMLHKAEILFAKNLKSDAFEFLKQAKKLSDSHDRFTKQLEVLQQTGRMGFLKGPAGKTYQEEVRILDICRNVCEYRDLSERFFNLQRKTGVYIKSGKERNLYKSILENPLFQDEKKALSYEAKNIFYYLNSAYSLACDAAVSALHYREKQILLMESCPERIRENFTAYLNALAQSGALQQKLKQHKMVINTSGKIRSSVKYLPAKAAGSRRVQYQTFRQSARLELVTFTDAGMFEMAEKTVREVMDGLIRFGEEMSPDTVAEFRYNIAYYYFVRGDYKNSLRLLHAIRNESPEKIQTDIQIFTRILLILNYYEINEPDLIEYHLKSTYRFLRKLDNPPVLINIIVNFFRKILSNIFTAEEIRKEFSGLKTELIELLRLPEVNVQPDFLFDVEAWLESKINNKSFGEVLRERSGGALNF